MYCVPSPSLSLVPPPPRLKTVNEFDCALVVVVVAVASVNILRTDLRKSSDAKARQGSDPIKKFSA